MPQICHKHCPPDDGGSTAVLAAVAVVAVAAVAGPAIIHAAEILLQVVLITCGVLAAAGVVAVAAVVTVRHRRRAAGAVVRVPVAAPARMLPAPPRAIEAPRAVITGRVVQAPAERVR